MKHIATALEAAGRAQLAAGKASIEAATKIRENLATQPVPVEHVEDETAEEELTIQDGKLVADGWIQDLTDDVTGIGKAPGFRKVHVNGSGEWWGTVKGEWKPVPVELVELEGVVSPNDDPIINPEGVKAKEEAGWIGELFPEGKVKRTLHSFDDPQVDLPEHFFGSHLELTTNPANDPDKRGRYFPVNLPTYDIARFRNINCTVDGKLQRGFWSNIEIAPGVYDWAFIRKWMASHDQDVLWAIVGTPSFYQAYPGEESRWPSWPGIASPPSVAGYVALKRFARAVKREFGKRIIGFEVWNEPTLPWASAPNAFDSRMHPEWVFEHSPGQAPQFTGSATDLANIAFVLNSANLGVPIYGCGFVDAWNQNQYTVDQFINAPVTLPDGLGTTGGDHIQIVSVHCFDYGKDPAFLIDEIDSYRAKLSLLGKNFIPMAITQLSAAGDGLFLDNDPIAARAIRRWAIFGSALVSEIYLDGHIAGPDGFGKIGGVQNVAIREAMQLGFTLGGTTIRKIVELEDGSAWGQYVKNGQSIIATA